MTRVLSSGMQTEVAANSLRPIILAELSFASGYVRAWSGYGSLVWNGNTYLGTGIFGGVSATEESTDMRSTGITLTLSGVDSTMLGTVLAEKYQGRPARLWFGCLDSSNAVIATPFLLFSGRMDTCNIQENGEGSSISINAESQLVDLKNPRVRRYTNEDQKQLFPGDLGLQFVAGLQNQSLTWGKAGAGAATDQSYNVAAMNAGHTYWSPSG